MAVDRNPTMGTDTIKKTSELTLMVLTASQAKLGV